MLALITLTMFGCQNNSDDDLQRILDTIVIPENVTGNLDLQSEYQIGNIIAKAEWQTTASKIITKEGIVTITPNDQTAVLIVKLTIGDASVTKQYHITVKGSEELLLLYAVVQNQLKFETTVLESDLVLPTEFIQDGKTVEAVWESENPSVLEDNGTIHRGNQDTEVTMKVTLSINGTQREESFRFTVLKVPSSEPVNWWHTAPVWKETIVGEANTPAAPNCFPGAIYRKVVSSDDYWLGIEGVLTIPEFTPDELRFDSTRQSYYLDNASLYMGGHAVYESDIGLTWSIGYPDSLQTAYTRTGLAFRPFWRYITRKEECTGNNCYRNSNVHDQEYYYFPGDKIRMSVFSPKSGYLQMRIELLEPTQIPKYAAQRELFDLGNDFNRLFTTPIFPSEGMGAGKAEFKRVNAIDQVNNEGKPTLNTNSKVTDAIWHEVYLYRMINNSLYKVPMTTSRSASMKCPSGRNSNGDFSQAIQVTYDNVDATLGGEKVTINPHNGTGKLYNSVALPVKPKKEYL